MKRRFAATSAVLLLSAILSGCAENGGTSEADELSGTVEISEEPVTTTTINEAALTFRTTTHTTEPTEFFSARSDSDPLWGGQIQTVVTTTTARTKKTTVSTTEEILMVIGPDTDETTTADTTVPPETSVEDTTMTEPDSTTVTEETTSVDTTTSTESTSVSEVSETPVTSDATTAPTTAVTDPPEIFDDSKFIVEKLSNIEENNIGYEVYKVTNPDDLLQSEVYFGRVIMEAPELGTHALYFYNDTLYYCATDRLFIIDNPDTTMICELVNSDGTSTALLWDTRTDLALCLTGFTYSDLVMQPTWTVYGPAMPTE